MDIFELKNRLTSALLCSGGIGVLLFASPVNQLAPYFVAGSGGFIVATGYILNESEKLLQRKTARYESEIQLARNTANSATKLLVDKHDELTKTLEALKEAYREYDDLGDSHDDLEDQIRDLKEELSSIKKINRESIIETLKDSLSELIDGVTRLVPYLIKKYQTSTDWDNLLAELRTEAHELLTQIQALREDCDSTNDQIISMALALQHEIFTKGNSLKAKCYREIINHFERQLQNLIPVDQHSSEIETLKQQIVKLKDYYSGNLKSVQNEFSQVADSVVVAYKQDFKEVIDSGTSQIQEIEYLQSEIISLNNRIKELSKPLRFPGLSEQARVGNAIIDYYSRLGYTLDAIDWTTLDTGYRLMFHTSRNGSRFISTDLLNDGDNSAKLKEVSASLNSPKFEQADRASYFSLTVQTRHKIKTSADDIGKLWLPSTQFPQLAKNWTRVRLTGGSESGKSPTAENIAVCILQLRSGVAKLFNPQHNSSKNYWSIPVVGTSHNDSENAIAKLAKLVDLRSTGQESRDTFELYIFDEIDSTMSHTHGKKSDIGNNIKFIIKQASHQNLGAIFIGQNANVTNYPGLDRSDWNNAINVHIGANCYDGITNSNLFTSEEQNKLKTTADKLTEYCQSKNDELGLDCTNPQAYRFAMVIEPGKKPYFIELPNFGKYTYDIVQSVETNDLKCPDCGSTAVKKNGRVNGQQRFKCNDCNKNWVM